MMNGIASRFSGPQAICRQSFLRERPTSASSGLGSTHITIQPLSSKCLALLEQMPSLAPTSTA